MDYETSRNYCSLYVQQPLFKMSEPRDKVFISKAPPGDNEFALWLAPRLEAACYKVFADVRELDGGDRWRKDLTDTLQNRAVKCCFAAVIVPSHVWEFLKKLRSQKTSLFR
jgi:TIR domain